METLSQCHAPGILLVTGVPLQDSDVPDIDHWYNTEHGPRRLKLGPKYFLNGYRYKGVGNTTTWLAMYDMPDLSVGMDPAYTILREKRSEQEQAIMKDKWRVLDRQFSRLTVDWGQQSGGPSPVLVVLHFERNRMAESFEDIQGDLQSLPSFLGTCRFRCFEQIEGISATENPPSYVAILEFASITDFYNVHKELAELLSISNSDNMPRYGDLSGVFELYHVFRSEDYIAPPCPDRA